MLRVVCWLVIVAPCVSVGDCCMLSVFRSLVFVVSWLLGVGLHMLAAVIVCCLLFAGNWLVFVRDCLLRVV